MAIIVSFKKTKKYLNKWLKFLVSRIYFASSHFVLIYQWNGYLNKKGTNLVFQIFLIVVVFSCCCSLSVVFLLISFFHPFFVSIMMNVTRLSRK